MTAPCPSDLGSASASPTSSHRCGTCGAVHAGRYMRGGTETHERVCVGRYMEGYMLASDAVPLCAHSKVLLCVESRLCHVGVAGAWRQLRHPAATLSAFTPDRPTHLIDWQYTRTRSSHTAPSPARLPTFALDRPTSYGTSITPAPGPHTHLHISPPPPKHRSTPATRPASASCTTGP